MIFVLFRESFWPGEAGGGLLEDAGGGAAAPLAGEGILVAAEEEVLLGEEVDACLVFSGTGGTKRSNRPLSSEPAPMLPAPVSSVSGGEEKASSAR